jgi:hypothetical protein
MTEEPKDQGLHIRKCHRTVATLLGMMEAPEDPDLHIMKYHCTVTTTLGTKEDIDDLGRHIEHLTIHAMEMLGKP